MFPNWAYASDLSPAAIPPIAAILGVRELSINDMAALSCAAADTADPAISTIVKNMFFPVVFIFQLFYILTKVPEATSLPSLRRTRLYVPGAMPERSTS